MKKLSNFKVTLIVLITILFVSSPIHLMAVEKSIGKESKKDLPAFIFSAKDIEGNKVDLADYLGKKIIVVNFWATWCPPCRFEIPELIKLQKVYKDKIQIIGVSLDRSLGDVKNYREHKLNYPIIWDRYGEIAYLYGGISSIPTTFIINTEGKIVERIIGARTFESFEYVIKKYIPKATNK